jgi:Holliday junction resolvase
MPKSQDNQVKCRLIPPARVPERRSAVVSTRPLKLAFLINEATPSDQLLKYFAYNTTAWGGFYNPLIPTDGQTLRSDWWRILLGQSPDKLIVCGNLSDDLLQELYARVQPFSLWAWSDAAIGGEKIDRDPFGNVPLVYQLLHVYETSRPISKSNFRVAQVSGDSSYSECAAAQFSVLPEPYEGVYRDALQAKAVDCGAGDLSDYLAHLIELEERLTPVKATRFGLSPVVEMSGTAFTIVLVGENPVADLCLFWNLRMRPSLGRTWTVALPASVLRRERDVRALAEWCNGAVLGTNYIVLASATLGRRRLLGLRKRLSPHLKSGVEHVDIWFDGFRVSPIRVFDTESSEDLMFEDGQFRLKAPTPSFAEQIRDGEWVVDVRLGEGKRHAPSSFLPPTFKGLSALLSGNPPDWAIRGGGLSARMAGGRISYLVRHGREFLTGNIPSDEEVFTALFDSKRYRFAQTDKCRYARGVTGLAGGLQELKIWRRAEVRDLFYAMRDGRSSYTPKEMMQWLRPKRGEAEQYYSMVTDLALKKVFLRGYKLRCPACDLTRWYPAAEFGESMPCAGCLTLLQPHVEAPFRYRLNDLVARGLDQGTMSLMLTVLFLRSLAETSFMYVPGVELLQTRKMDVDIVASCDGHLILAECKDLRSGVSAQTIKEVVGQLTGLIEVARDVGAEIVILSVLQPNVPKDLHTRVSALGKKWKNSIAVHLVTGHELEQGYRMKPMGKFLSPEDPSKETKSSLRDFLLPSSEREKGWVKDRGVRSISF